MLPLGCFIVSLKLKLDSSKIGTIDYFFLVSVLSSIYFVD